MTSPEFWADIWPEPKELPEFLLWRLSGDKPKKRGSRPFRPHLAHYSRRNLSMNNSKLFSWSWLNLNKYLLNIIFFIYRYIMYLCASSFAYTVVLFKIYLPRDLKQQLLSAKVNYANFLKGYHQKAYTHFDLFIF